jgi:D-alanyl-D-alanine carboxypeptidase
MIMKSVFLSLAIVLVSIASSQTSQDVKKIRKLFEMELGKKEVHNASFALYSDQLELNLNWTEGEFKDGTRVTKENPYHSASIGKSFTATAVVMLQEQGKLAFDDPISRFLSHDVMNHLHVFEGTDYSEQITIAHLLQHRSGLPDYFEDEPLDSPTMRELLISDPQHFWTPTELLGFAKEKMTCHFPPGAGYHYSDTEYILLGIIIENITGMNLHEVFQKWIFEPLEMTHTSMHLRSEPIESTSAMAEIYVDDIDISGYTSLSLDWAGGGLLTTNQDLLKFHQALMSGKLISNNSLQKMQDFTKESQGMYYGFGLRKIELKELFFALPDVSLIGHSGSTGSFMYYCPEWSLYLIGTFNQTKYLKKHVRFLTKVMTVLKNSAES